MSGVIAIIGIGLIGGSVAKSLRRLSSDHKIVGIGRLLSELEPLLESGLIDRAYTLSQLPRIPADIVVACTPIPEIIPVLSKVAKVVPEQALFTDVGSTKKEIITEASKYSWGNRFVGAHPLAGSEKSGVSVSQAELFQNRICILTPIEKNPETFVKRCAEFWQLLGCRIEYLTPDQHDEILARTSHIPHIGAAILASLIHPDEKKFTAGGWRDTTRIASGNPELWRGILMSNREAIQQALKRFADRIEDFRFALEQGDSERLFQLLLEGKVIRDDLGS